VCGSIPLMFLGGCKLLENKFRVSTSVQVSQRNRSKHSVVLFPTPDQGA
jgi:hypothetical protein